MAQKRPYAEVIGDPIDHSRSPVIHGFWLAELGIDSDYQRVQVKRNGLADYLDRRRPDRLWRGSNVTMPLKLDAITLADEASDRALGAGAANILLPRGDKLIAGNTDVGAVAAIIGKLAAKGAAMRSVTLLGSGGAARASLMALHLLGIHSVCIQARNLSEAYKLAVQFGMQIDPREFDAPVETDGLIQTTPLGMAGHPPLAIDVDAIPADGWVFDFVTSPRRTRLIHAADERGLRTVDGIAMLVEQAAESFKLLFGADAPRHKDRDLLALLED